MTAKPSPVGIQVGIQRYQRNKCSMQPNLSGPWMLYSIHQAVLNRVREMLEAKAKEFKRFAAGANSTGRTEVYQQCASELLSLAATLEPGAADVETPGEMK